VNVFPSYFADPIPNTRMTPRYASIVLLALSWTTTHAQECANGRYVDVIFPEVQVTEAIPFGSNTAVSGGTQQLLMDVYSPVGDSLAARPVVIIAFGGSFVAGSRGDVAPLCQAFAARGYVAVAPDYRVGFFLPNALTTTLAVVRGSHDMKACIRFLRKSVEEGNPYGIDPERIIAGGVSAGAISAIHATYLDSDAEMPPALGAQAAQLGGAEGNSGNPGYSSSVLACLSFSGAIGDTSWVTAGDPPLHSIHEDGDGVVPYFTEEVSVFGIPTGLIASGSHDLHLRMDNVGVGNCLLTYDADTHVGYLTSDTENAIAFAAERCARVVCGLEGGCEELTTAVPTIADGHTISAAPNPTNGELRVDVQGTNDLILHDLRGAEVGRQVRATGPVRMDLSSLPAGVYHLRVIGAEPATLRVVKW
jgi:poly(3-hydroxybutyrate) depolymerase